MDLSSLITLATIVFCMLKITSGLLKIFWETGPGADLQTWVNHAERQTQHTCTLHLLNALPPCFVQYFTKLNFQGTIKNCHIGQG